MTDLAKRYRAARAWADMTQEQLAERLGVDVATVKRREAGDGDPKKAEQIAVAHICKVPVDFLLGGFPALGGEPTTTEIRDRLDRLEGSVRFLVGRAAGQPLVDLLGELTDRTTRALLGQDESQVDEPAPSSVDGEDDGSEDDQALP